MDLRSRPIFQNTGKYRITGRQWEFPEQYPQGFSPIFDTLNVLKKILIKGGQTAPHPRGTAAKIRRKITNYIFVFDRMAYLCLFAYDQIHGLLSVHGPKLLPHVDW